VDEILTHVPQPHERARVAMQFLRLLDAPQRDAREPVCLVWRQPAPLVLVANQRQMRFQFPCETRFSA
jgi:hypothetical protein